MPDNGATRSRRLAAAADTPQLGLELFVVAINRALCENHRYRKSKSFVICLRRSSGKCFDLTQLQIASRMPGASNKARARRPLGPSRF